MGTRGMYAELVVGEKAYEIRFRNIGSTLVSGLSAVVLPSNECAAYADVLQPGESYVFELPADQTVAGAEYVDFGYHCDGQLIRRTQPLFARVEA